MKKRLFGILTFLGIGLSFCSAGDGFTLDSFTYLQDIAFQGGVSPLSQWGIDLTDKTFFLDEKWDCPISITDLNGNVLISGSGIFFYFDSNDYNFVSSDSCMSYCEVSFYTGNVFPTFQGGSSSATINVLYNNQNSTETITCDGDNIIQIDGLSSITATNVFTPYYNITYRDEDNQLLTESYSKSSLLLSGGTFKKTYTGDNERILTDTIESPNSSFTGYVPVFDFTGDTIVNTGNVFNNFSDNALKVLLSNIPSYIQYITIFAILVFLFSFIRRFKRKS